MSGKIVTMNVSLPAAYRDYVKARMEQGGFCNVSEYIRHLIREDQKNLETETLRRLLKEGIESGPATPLTKEDFDGIRRRVRERATARERKL